MAVRPSSEAGLDYMWWAGHKSTESVSRALTIPYLAIGTHIPVLIWNTDIVWYCDWAWPNLIWTYQRRRHLIPILSLTETLPIRVQNSRRQLVREHQVEISDLRCLLMIRVRLRRQMLGFRLTCFPFWIMIPGKNRKTQCLHRYPQQWLIISFSTLSHWANVVLLSLVLIHQENKKHTGVSITSIPFQSNVAIAVTQKFRN